MNASLRDNTPSSQLVDTHGRTITYLRLSITDRCNLRCRYCMPENGVEVMDHSEILSYEELLRISHIFVKLGVNKIRITGGEPFARKNCYDFMQSLMAQTPDLDLRITTNGVAVLPYLSRLKKLGIQGMNLSLDTLNRERFKEISRRDCFDKVRAVFDEALRIGIPLKVNSVVQENTTDQELIEMTSLAKENHIQIRFIELMPFSGKDNSNAKVTLSLEERLFMLFPNMKERVSLQIETARKFMIDGYRGSFGIIEGESRKFCKQCNKVRLTSSGMLKNCLYDSGVLDLRELLRSDASDVEITKRIQESVMGKLSDGHETAKLQNKQCEDSMATIGG